MNPNRSKYPDEQQGLSFVLAVGMHVLLAGFLLFSVQWKTKQPEPVVVELWGAPPPAPVASEQNEQIKPVKVPEPKPEPIPVPIKAPDIVTEKVKATAVPTAKPTATAKPTLAPTAKPTVAPTPKPTVVPSAKPKATAAPTTAPKKAEVKKPKSELENALSFDNMLDSGSKGDKPNPNAKAGGKPGGTGDTVGATGGAGKGKGSGLGEAYAQSIGQEIAQKAVYVSSSGKKPRVVYKIHLFPSGEIQRIELLEASKDPVWDKAIERAIHLYAPFPKPPNGASFNDYREVRWAFSPP